MNDVEKYLARNRKIYTLRKGGMKQRELAEMFSLSKSRIRYICVMEEKYIANPQRYHQHIERLKLHKHMIKKDGFSLEDFAL